MEVNLLNLEFVEKSILKICEVIELTINFLI